MTENKLYLNSTPKFLRKGLENVITIAELETEHLKIETCFFKTKDDEKEYNSH